jgi:predicted DsbA family dithiol-disulfide isomerase
MSLHLDIQIVSDVICPWCYLGNARLDKALARLTENYPHHISVSKHWIPYLLNPTMVEGQHSMSKRDMYLKKFNNNNQQVQRMEQKISDLYVKAGLPPYTLDGKVGATFAAHRLMALAKEQNRATELMHVLFRQYHSEGKSPSVHANLVEASVEAELQNIDVLSFLKSDEKLNEVAAALQTNAHVFPMLSGVPHFRLAVASRTNKELRVHSVIPGAQDVSTFLLSIGKFLTRAGYSTESVVAAAVGQIESKM